MQIYSEKIDVRCEGEPSMPVSFSWQETEFRIEKIVKIRQDWGFPAGAPRRKTWRLRRHRTYFKVRVEGDRTFEIYMDRKTPEPTWVLYREIED